MYKRIIGIFVVVVIAGAGVAFALSAAEKKKKDDLYRQLELFSDVLTIVQSDYVTETQPKDLIYGALKGMISSLDAHSQFMDPDTYNELKTETEGKFGGLGIEITIKDGLLTVVTPIEDTPAWKAGIKANDRIVKINNELTRDMTITDAVKKLRGKPGETVNITILRESEKKILEFRLVRDVIKIKDIKEAKLIDDSVGYIRLVEFRENTPSDFNTAVEKLKKEGMKALILDLRNNPGGLLESAIEVCEKFVERGKLILSTQGRIPNQNLQFISHANRPITDMPMVVLINEGSASGSEIVAGCLQDYKRALILGTKSFGKGSVQTVIPLSDGSALRLTTSKYYTPLGREIHGKGVIPDIAVEDGNIEYKKEPINLEKPEYIFEELEDKTKSRKQEETQEEKIDKIRLDNQLMKAVDILKAMLIYKSPGCK